MFELLRSDVEKAVELLRPWIFTRFGVASTLDLRDSLAAIHLEAGLLGRIHARQEAQQQRGRAREQYLWDAELEEAAAAEDEVDAALARSLLGWLRVTVASVRPKLYPPGLMLHTTAAVAADFIGQDSSWVVGAELAGFGELRLSGTMGSSHLPQAYAKALLGDCPVGRGRSSPQVEIRRYLVQKL